LQYLYLKKQQLLIWYRNKKKYALLLH
jgi:hypothetical protein